jgi:hypothetical protein
VSGARVIVGSDSTAMSQARGVWAVQVQVRVCGAGTSLLVCTTSEGRMQQYHIRRNLWGGLVLLVGLAVEY